MCNTSSTSAPTQSERIIQSPHHTDQPMQTQQQAPPPQMQVGIPQYQTEQLIHPTTMPPASTYDPFSGLKAKKRDKPITLVEQDGANCGCFAAGMAIASLIRIGNVAKLKDGSTSYEKAYTSETNKEQVIQFGDSLAQAIQRTAQDLNLSAVGEMFDAEALATTINLVLNNSDAVGAKKVGKYFAKVAQFSNEDQLTKILNRADDLGVRVLISYLANDEVMPDTSLQPASCPPQEMYRAHWCCIRLKPSFDKSSPPKVCIYEGNQMVQTPVLLSNVYTSNQALAATMDWNGYLSICEEAEWTTAIEGLCCRAQKAAHSPNKDQFNWLSEIKPPTKTVPFKPPIEPVNLRGQVILIGKKADPPQGASAATPPAVEAAPAAPSPTQQTASTDDTE